jgi:hypothetical protein
MTEEGDLVRRVFEAGSALVEFAEGDIGFSRQLWNDAFEEAERIDHNQPLDDDLSCQDEEERAFLDEARRHDEATRRLEQAVAARRKFRVVSSTPDSEQK